MNTMKILLVEDAKDQQHIFEDVVNVFNENHNLNVELDIATDTPSALEKIDNSYDGVIIDMRLGNDHQGGNEVVRRLHDLSISVPVIFVTAYLDLVVEDPLIIKKRSRGVDTYESDLLLFKEWHSAELVTKETAQTYTALIRESEGWWIGWILEVRGVTCQERTRSELLDTLQITLREVLEFDPPEASRRTESEVEKIKVSDLLESGVQEASSSTESEFEEVKIAICWTESESDQKQASTTGKNLIAQRLIKAMEEPPYLTDEDIEALHQSIEAGKIPIKFDSPFEPDEPEKNE